MGLNMLEKEEFGMIKLIASDMDATFLDENQCVPEGAYRSLIHI